MSSPSTSQFQKAIYSALSSDLGIQALIGNPARVFDWVPDESVFPYITVGDTTDLPYDSQTFDGLETTINIHSWTRDQGRIALKQLMDQIYKVLHLGTLAMANQALIVMRFEFGHPDLDPDGVTYHGVQRFRALIQGV